eukprot:scaffold102925_cov60-Phaeocystis_antarctica.AAC.2
MVERSFCRCSGVRRSSDEKRRDVRRDVGRLPLAALSGWSGVDSASRSSIWLHEGVLYEGPYGEEAPPSSASSMGMLAYRMPEESMSGAAVAERRRRRSGGATVTEHTMSSSLVAPTERASATSSASHEDLLKEACQEGATLRSQASRSLRVAVGGRRAHGRHAAK